MERIAEGPHGCAAWASAWGEDRFGVWAELRVEVAAGSGESATAEIPVVQRMRWIPPGEFWMGSGPEDKEAYGDEKPQHFVRLNHGFWLGDTPVTQEVYGVVMGENPSTFAHRADSAWRPVEGVDGHSAAKFAFRLESRIVRNVGQPVRGFALVRDSAVGDGAVRDSAVGDGGEGDGGVGEHRVGADGLGFRLPTEVEWEYACRAGTTASRYGPLDAVGWYEKNSGGETHPVRLKAPNGWGLYDMLGNVWEWCADGNGLTGTGSPPFDPETAPGPRRHIRGGSWFSDALDVRAAYRFWLEPGVRDHNLGFRILRGMPLKAGTAAGRVEVLA